MTNVKNIPETLQDSKVGITKQEVLIGLRVEREYVSRDCNRDCANCDIVQERGGKMFGLSVREFKILLSIILVAIYVAATIYRWRKL